MNMRNEFNINISFFSLSHSRLTNFYSFPIKVVLVVVVIFYRIFYNGECYFIFYWIHLSARRACENGRWWGGEGEEPSLRHRNRCNFATVLFVCCNNLTAFMCYEKLPTSTFMLFHTHTHTHTHAKINSHSHRHINRLYCINGLSFLIVGHKT